MTLVDLPQIPCVLASLLEEIRTSQGTLYV